MTPLQKERLELVQKLEEYKLHCEANIVSIVYKDTESMYHIDLNYKEFSNDVWQVYFSIAKGVIIDDKKEFLDEITVGLYLEKHSKLKAKYEEFGGYKTISEAMKYVHIENLEGYLKEFKKWSVLIGMAKLGFPIKNRLSDYTDTDIDDIQSEWEAVLNDLFIKADTSIKVYNPLDGLTKYIEEADKGMELGLPIYNSDILNNEIGGINFNGKIYGLGAPTGEGKSTTAINYLLPSILEHDEKIVFMINEEGIEKVQKELLIWVANNVLHKTLHKITFRNGGFTNEIWAILREAAEWLNDKKDRKNILVIPLPSYNAKKVIQLIRKYSSLGCRLFVLDTFKESNDIGNEQSWKSMERDSKKFYDCIKKDGGKNVSLFITYQLSKSSIRTRCYTNFDVGQSKSILDVFHANIMMRRPFKSEFEGGHNEIIVETGRTIEGSKVNVKLDPNKHYMIIFITKNRSGSASNYQIVAEYDLSTNVYKEIGITRISEDW